jgi:hypothetical protein
VNNLDKWLVIGEVFAEPVSHINRSVLATGAANSHGEITAVIGLEFGDPAGQKANYIGEHRGYIHLAFQKLNDVWIPAGLHPQFPFPMGVGKAAYIENKICILWGATLKPKALKQNRHMLHAVGYNGVFDQISQLMQ